MSIASKDDTTMTSLVTFRVDDNDKARAGTHNDVTVTVAMADWAAIPTITQVFTLVLKDPCT